MSVRELRAGTRLPATIVDRAPASAGIGLVLFGLAFTAFPVFFAYLVLSGAKVEGNMGPAGMAVFLAVFAAIGIAISAWGVARLRYRLEVTVDHGEVRGSARGILGTQEWREPRDRYRGVLQKTVVRSRGKNRGSYSIYLVVLKHHRDDSRDVPLFRSLEGAGHRAETERLARLLDTPVLVESAGGGFEVRAVADLDKSIAERAAEGSLAIPDAPEGRLDSGRIRSLPSARGYAFEQNFGTAATMVGMWMLAVGAGLLVLYVVTGMQGWTGDVRMVVPGGIALVTLGIAAAIVGRMVRRTLEVDPRGVTVEFRLGTHVLSRHQLPAQTIEEVKRVRGAGLSVVSDTQTAAFGIGLEEDEVEHVRDAVLATLAGGAVRAVRAPLSPQVERLREFAVKSLEAGETPEQVAEKIAGLGVPADDVAACLRALADELPSPRTASRPAAAATTRRRGAAGRRRPGAPGTGSDPYSRYVRGLVALAGIAVPAGVALYMFGPALLPDLFPRAPDPVRTAANERRQAEQVQIDEQFGAYPIRPAVGTGHVYVAGRGITAEAVGNDLRIALAEIRLRKRSEWSSIAYESLGIGVYTTASSGSKQSKAVWNREIRGTLDAATPEATLRDHVFTVPGMAAICASGCRARLLLSVRTGQSATYAENTRFAMFAVGAGQAIATPAPTPSRHWDTYYDRAVAAKSAKRYDESQARFEETLAFIDANLGADHPAKARTLMTMAHLHELRQRSADYAKAMRQAWEILDPYPDTQVKAALAETRLHVDKELVARRLGDFYWDERDYEKGYTWYKRAHAAAPGLDTSEYSRNLKRAFSAAGVMATACMLGKFDEADAAMTELKNRIDDVEKATRPKLQYWIDTGEPRLAARQC